MPTFQDQLDAMHKDPAYQAADSETRAQWDRDAFDRVRAKAQQDTSQNMAAARSQPGVSGAASEFAQRAAATINGVGNMATLGRAPAVAAGLSKLVPASMGGQLSTPEVQGQADALSQQFPTSDLLGNLAGSFTGAPGLIGKGVSAVAGAGRAALTSAVPALENTFARRMLTNLATNALSSTGAVTTATAAQSRNDDPTLGQRLRDGLEMSRQVATSPLGAGLLLGGSALQSVFPPRMTGDVGNAIDRFERTTGQKVPPEIMAGDKGMQRTAKWLAQFDADANDHFRAQAIEGLQSYVDDVASRAGSETPTPAGAEGIRKLVGTRAAPGPIDLERRSLMEKAFTASRERGPSDAVTNVLQQAAWIIRSARPKGLTSKLDDTLSTIQDGFTTKAGTRVPMTVDTLDGLIKQVDGLLDFSRQPMDAASAVSKDLTMHEAGMLRQALVLSRSAFPEVNNASAVAADLHALQAPLRDVNLVPLSDGQYAEFFSRFTPRLWDSTQQYGPEIMGQLKGYYFSQLANRIVDKGTVNVKKLDALLREPNGLFNNETMATVLGPSTIADLRTQGAVGKLILNNGRYAARPAGVSTGSFMRGVLTDPGTTLVRVLGPFGVKTVVAQALRGIGNDYAQQVVRSGPTPIGSSQIGAGRLLSTLPNQSLPTQGGTQ